MRKNLMLIIFGLQCLDIVIGRIVDDFDESTKLFSKYTVGELLSLDIPKKTSDDLYMDPCKASRFVGDIALAEEDYHKVIFKDESYLKHIENYKEEILEGLQIEEEGLSSVLRQKNKHSNIVSNDPLDITSLEDVEMINKYTPTLKQRYSQRLFLFKDKKRKPSGDKKRVVDGSENSSNNTIPTGKNEYNLKKTDLLEEHDTPKTKRSTNSKRSYTDAPSVKSTASKFVKAYAEDNIHSIKHHKRVSRAATARKERVWDYGVIPYEIDGNFSGAHRALFKRAMRHWENFTCVKFVERNKDEHLNFIVFTERPCGCCSFVGKRGNGGQAISIGRNCDKFGIVVHELGHVVGFWHEHTRPDRDKHVNIIRENIMSGQEYNFNKLNEEEVNSLGLTYDHDSIMHYARNTFSKGTYLDTIQPVDIPGKKRPEIGQRIRLSAGDIAQTNLLYKCTKCGRTYQGNYGVFSSPSYIQQSGTEVERCEWRITANHGEKIVLNITDVDIEKSKDCTTDYIEIRDGYWHNSMKLGRFCGSGRPASITSTSSRILITYVNNDPIGHKGFVATYEVTCGGDLSVETEVHLESPNFPDEYQPNKECVWRITVPKDYQVAIKFQSFEVENHDNCVYDYLEVKDDALQEVIGVYCGYKIPLDVISSSNSLLIKFVSDASVQKGGFSATIMKKYDECNRTDHGCEQECINKLGGYTCSCRIGYELHSDGKHCEVACGGIFNSSEGTITSPSFPELYPVNKVCIWEILTQEHYRITINFTHFDLEGNDMHQSQYQQCDYDNIEVLSKLVDGTSKKHGLFCGSKAPNPITSEGNVIRIIFRSDTSVQKTGFAAIYSTGKDECSFNNGGCQHKCIYTFGTYVCTCFDGFKIHGNGLDCKEDCKNEITNSMGVFGSPNYPDYYPSKKICVWHFKTRPGHRIRISFLTFEVEAHPDCYYDHVDFYDGASTGALTLGRFCGSKLPQLIVGSGNHLYMTFKSDSSVQRKGFWATHATVCGGILQATADKKHIYSHAKFGSTNYDNKADCDWTIQAPADYSVQLTFLTFDLEYEANCQHDHLEIFNGLDSSSRTLGKFCGKTKPADLFSTNDALLLRFITDDTIVGKGFSLEYKAVEIEYSGEDM